MPIPAPMITGGHEVRLEVMLRYRDRWFKQPSGHGAPRLWKQPSKGSKQQSTSLLKLDYVSWKMFMCLKMVIDKFIMMTSMIVMVLTFLISSVSDVVTASSFPHARSKHSQKHFLKQLRKERMGGFPCIVPSCGAHPKRYVPCCLRHTRLQPMIAYVHEGRNDDFETSGKSHARNIQEC